MFQKFFLGNYAKKSSDIGQNCTAGAKLRSMCPKEKLEKNTFLSKNFKFFPLFWILGKNLLAFMAKLRAGLSKLHSSLPNDHFEEKIFFGKVHIR